MADTAHPCALTQGPVDAVPQQFREQTGAGVCSSQTITLCLLKAHLCDNLRFQQHNKGEIYPHNVRLISAELMAHEMCWLVLCRPGI